MDFGLDNDGLLLRTGPDLLYSPDASLYLKRQDSPLDLPWMEFCPELVVEVTSRSNTPALLAHKIHDYLDAGVEQVWIVNPHKKTADIIFQDGRRNFYEANDTIQCEGIAKGLVISLISVFKV